MIKKYKIFVILGILVIGCGIIYGFNYFDQKNAAHEDAKTVIKGRADVTAGDLARRDQMLPMPETDESELPQTPIKVKVLRAYRMDFKDSIALIGTVRGYSEIMLKFSNGGGRVDHIYFYEGQSVQKGDVIASLDKREADLQWQDKKLEYEKNRKLYEAGAINKSALEKARIAMKAAAVELEKTDIIAPCNGMIAKMDVDEGNVVDEIGMMINTDFVWVELSVIEQEIQRVQLGQRMELRFDAFPGRVFESLVNRISPIVEGTSRTITIKTRVDNLDGALVTGMFARARVFIHEQENVIVVPGGALKDLDRNGLPESVYVVDDTLQLQGRRVSVSYLSPGPALTYAEIKKGLKEGDLVVVYEPTPDAMRIGAPVKIIEPILTDVDMSKP